MFPYKEENTNTSFKKTVHVMSDTENESSLRNDCKIKNSVKNRKSRKLISKSNVEYVEDEMLKDISVEKQASWINNYIQDKNKLIKTDYVTNLKLSEISKGNELFILQCPKSLNPALLLKKKINLNNNSLTHFVNEDLELDVNNKHRKLCLLASKSDDNLRLGVKQLHFTAGFRIRESMKEESKSELITVDNNINVIENNIKFPVDLKTRHPLFGPDFKTNLKLETFVKEKLRKTEHKKQKRLKRKMKSFAIH